MKKIFSYLTAAAVIAGTASCSEEQTMPVGEGTLYISTRVNSDVVVESRAEAEEDLAATTKIWIYSPEGVVRKFNGISDVPAGGLKLISGNYTVKAWAGTAEYASFTSRWFEGATDVEVTPGKPQAVEVVCKIANVVASVSYADNVGELITDDCTLTISHKGGSLTFEGKDDARKGYYMMPEGVTTLDYTLNFTTAEGEDKEVHGTIANVEPAHEYVLNVTVKENEEEADGAAFIEIIVDDTMLEVSDEILITTPPAITGYGFDLNSPVAGQSGTIGRKSIYVAAAADLAKIELSGMPGIDDVDLLRASEEYLIALKEQGVFSEDSKDYGKRLIKVVFEDTYINALENSETPYVITIKATDSYGKTATATLTLRITEADVVTAEIPAEAKECYFEQTLSATVAKDGVEFAGFEYAVDGTEDWQVVEGRAESRAAFAKGSTYYATITDLRLGTKYKYRAVAGSSREQIEYRADEATFSTGTLNQLPNASFENWFTASDKAIVPAISGSEAWDCGNHGSATMGVQLTQSNTDYVHSGTQGARLRSQFVGLGGSIGKFAAGNIFYGKYIKTDGTDGVIGFGRPFDFPSRELKPVAVKMWVKYETAAAIKSGAGDYVPQGTDDSAHIFVALFDSADNGDSDAANNGKYGYVVRTKKQPRLFNKNASNVIAYGEQIYTGNTPGDGLIELTIPFEYYRDAQPKLIAVVCTASRYGDYFQGGEGATLWVDDVEIVYGKK